MVSAGAFAPAETTTEVVMTASDRGASPRGGAGAGSEGTGRLGALALIALAPIWGYGWVSLKVCLDDSGPFFLGAFRMVLSVACLFLVMVLTRRPLRPPAFAWVLGIGLLQTTCFTSLSTWALVSGGAGRTSVIVYTMPFWLLLLARVFLGERLRGIQWAAACLAFAGLALIIEPWRLDGLFAGLLALGSGFSWAASAVLVKLLQARRHVELLTITTWQMALGVVPLIIIAVLVPERSTDWTAALVGNLLYVVLVANVVAWILWLFALRSLSSAAALGALGIPVVGVIASWIQLGERPDIAEGTGMLLVLGGLAILALQGLLAARGGDAAPGEEPAVRPMAE